MNGRYLTAKDTFHRIGNGSSLSDILEENVDEKYYLSEQQTKFILNPMRLKKKYTVFVNIPGFEIKFTTTV